MKKTILIHFNNRFLELGLRSLLETDKNYFSMKLQCAELRSFAHILFTDDVTSTYKAEQNDGPTLIICFGADKFSWVFSLDNSEVISWQWLFSKDEDWRRYRIAEKEGLTTLTMKEIIVLKHIAQGIRQKEIANRFSLPAKKVSFFKRRAMMKLGLRNLSDLVVWLEGTSHSDISARGG